MKNEDIQKGFDQAGIRDFLAQQYVMTWRGCAGQSPESLQAELDRLTEVLKAAKALAATKELAARQGWDFWDVSDEISDYSDKTYFNFVGTEEEHDSIFPLGSKA